MSRRGSYANRKSRGTSGALRILGFGLLLASLAMAGCSLPKVQTGLKDDPPACRLNVLELEESSGVAYSYRYDGLLYTHNDSGDTARIFAFDTKCHERGMFEIEGVEALDWEDMCSFAIEGRPYLLLADTGDNLARRKFYSLYIIEEPEISQTYDGTPTMVGLSGMIQFVFPDGPHDCESVAVDMESMTILLATKRQKGWAHLYGIPLSAVHEKGVIMARALATLPVVNATAMDMSRSGRHLVLLTYGDAYEFSRQGNEPWLQAFIRPPRVLPMPRRAKGESICYSPDGTEFYLTSEGLHMPLWIVPRQLDQP